MTMLEAKSMTTSQALRAQVREEIARVLPGVTTIRRDLHTHPELSDAEHRTSALVERELRTLGLEVRAGLAKGTGVIAHLPSTLGPAGGAISDGAVALRADMDALPIHEQTGVAYASTTPGVMHACGHDGHTAILLGAARVLASLPHRANPVTFVFQPAEEHGGGAQIMCADGALRGAAHGGVGAPVSRIYGLHGWPSLPLGEVATRPGPLLAATDDFTVRVRGVGGHAAMPHLARDPVVCAAAMVTALQTIASRAASPLDSVVCTVARIAGGSANNIIPDVVELDGTVRTLRPETRTMAKARFFEVCEGVANAHGCRAEIDWSEGYPVTSNDAGLVDRWRSVAEGALGAARVREVPEAFMGGEDFSYYGAHVPACFYLLGLLRAGDDPLRTPRLHQATFDFNDDALATGVEMMCMLALEG
ncbi:MAG: amidohydrolase [Phycisphaerales bacterium]|jgi:hippurate hydrolase|nr:amidohydrolase [Phycisphaerales bacterium]